jgi:hypothetical protein
MKSTESGNSGFSISKLPLMYHLWAFRPLKNAASNHLLMRSETREGLRSNIMNVEFGFVASAIGVSIKDSAVE